MYEDCRVLQPSRKKKYMKKRFFPYVPDMRLPNDEMILKSFPSQIEYEMESNKNVYINILMKIPFFLHGELRFHDGSFPSPTIELLAK